ncbi:MAG: hypothetical protein KKF44_08940 [Nanoarchaeota archaeon]|nr:hypothetical protein [Nanoarchaeota archaeon]
MEKKGHKDHTIHKYHKDHNEHAQHKKDHKSEDPKSKKKFPVMLLVIILAIYLVPAFFLGLFPFNSPRDLGVRYTEQDFLSSLNKIGGRLEELPKGTVITESIQMEGAIPVDVSFSSEELTAAADSRKWIYYPVKDPQVKVNPDGTVEASAIIRTGRLLDYALATKTPKYYVDLFDKFNILPNPAVYVKAKGSVENNRIVGADLQEAQIGKIKIPDSAMEAVEDELITFIEGGLDRTPGLDVQHLDFDGGNLNIEGTIPAVEKTVNS